MDCDARASVDESSVSHVIDRLRIWRIATHLVIKVFGRDVGLEGNPYGCPRLRGLVGADTGSRLVTIHFAFAIDFSTDGSLDLLGGQQLAWIPGIDSRLRLPDSFLWRLCRASS